MEQKALLKKIGGKPEGKYFAAVDDDHRAAVTAGLVVGNKGVTNPRNKKQIAFKLTPAGVAALDAAPASSGKAEVTPSVFTIYKATPPKIERGGRAGVSKYPFDQLDNDTGFFIPKSTTKAKKPAKAFGSNISQQHNKFNTADDFRRFTVRTLSDGADFGQPGVPGIGIYRVSAEDEAEALKAAKKNKTLS